MSKYDWNSLVMQNFLGFIGIIIAVPADNIILAALGMLLVVVPAALNIKWK